MKLHRLAQALTGTLASAVLVGGLAQTAEAATSESFMVDDDIVFISETDFRGVVSGRFLVVHQAGAVQGHVKGWIDRKSSVRGCRSLRVIYTYADRSPETKHSRRVCSEHGVTMLPADLWSSPGKNLVKVAVNLMKSTDSTAPLEVVAGRTHLVGNAPDSWGKAERLDHDGFLVNKTYSNGYSVNLFTGATDWSLRTYSAFGNTATATMARVTGQLRWSDSLSGVRAGVTAIWTYADGSTSRSSSGTVTRGGTPIDVDLKSDPTKDTLSVRVTVRSWADDNPFLYASTEQATAHGGKFGDHGFKP